MREACGLQAVMASGYNILHIMARAEWLKFGRRHFKHNDGFVQYCGNFIALAMELLHSYAKPSTCPWKENVLF